MFESDTPHKETIPCEGPIELSRMQLLCVLRCLRPDKVVAAVQDYVAGRIFFMSTEIHSLRIKQKLLSRPFMMQQWNILCLQNLDHNKKKNLLNRLSKLYPVLNILYMQYILRIKFLTFR